MLSRTQFDDNNLNLKDPITDDIRSSSTQTPDIRSIKAESANSDHRSKGVFYASVSQRNTISNIVKLIYEEHNN